MLEFFDGFDSVDTTTAKIILARTAHLFYSNCQNEYLRSSMRVFE